MKRILLVTSIFPPEIGGPATFMDHLAHELSERGYQVTVICDATSPVREPSDAERPFRVVRIYSRLWAIQVYKLIPILAWYMLWHDAVLVNGLEYSAYWASKISGRRYLLKIVGDSAWEEARRSGVTSLSIDDFQKFESVTGRVKRLREWRRKYLGGASEVIVPSKYLKKIVSGWNFPPDRIRVIYNGVSLSGNEARLLKKRVEGEALQVVFVGRLTNWKGVETLLLASAKVDGVQIHILGNGPEYPLLTELAEQLRLSSRVKFWGSLDHNTLDDVMKNMDVLVLGSSYEGLSHTLLEACAMEVPCVSSSSGGNPEVIKHLENGLLFPYGDVEALVNCLQMLRDNEPLRVDLARKARESMTNFNFENTIQNTIQALLEPK